MLPSAVPFVTSPPACSRSIEHNMLPSTWRSAIFLYPCTQAPPTRVLRCSVVDDEALSRLAIGWVNETKGEEARLSPFTFRFSFPFITQSLSLSLPLSLFLFEQKMAGITGKGRTLTTSISYEVVKVRLLRQCIWVSSFKTSHF